MSRDTLFGILLSIQTGTGFLGNSLLFALYMHTFFSLPRKKKPADGILAHLTLANALTLLFRGVPSIISSFGMRPEIGDTGCKVVLYTHRVTRSISLYTTSLQSTFQAVTIAVSGRKWTWLKNNISTLIQPSIFSCWVINMVIYSEIILKVVANRNTTDVTSGYYGPFCKVSTYDHQVAVTILSIVLIQDVLFLSLMACSSVYMVTVLSRHHRVARLVRSSVHSSRSSPEHRATHVILMLVCCFIFFYWTNSFLTAYPQFGNKRNWQLENVNAFISSCYPTICPFVLMKNENRISRVNFMNRRTRIFFHESKLNDPMNTPQHLSSQQDSFICVQSHKVINGLRDMFSPHCAELTGSKINALSSYETF
ncbi:LOW QUALITY PROTEIN: vomeronasal type-1 receptor 3-like [Phyllostomus hastatus]|uniref:LOW QUALITY PROTEIN: vomeronasal type-1 receptor 3-like n=1 Tax=Phyllostomus hastatus TaxID=9423 RepID=UPI001E682F23|nr:LOW QUALITY PROTEIN: vomeronasal type-1 receptor 3-like [Phyllostomus hastatus]